MHGGARARAPRGQSDAVQLRGGARRAAQQARVARAARRALPHARPGHTYRPPPTLSCCPSTWVAVNKSRKVNNGVYRHYILNTYVAK